MLGVKLEVAVVLQHDDFTVILRQDVELDGLAVIATLELHGEVADVITADAWLVDSAGVDVLLVRGDVYIVTHSRHVKVLKHQLKQVKHQR